MMMTVCVLSHHEEQSHKTIIRLSRSLRIPDVIIVRLISPGTARPIRNISSSSELLPPALVLEAIATLASLRAIASLFSFLLRVRGNFDDISWGQVWGEHSGDAAEFLQETKRENE
jgi:hypothetical protein